MLETPCHIISDIHLGVTSEATERLFEGYLRSLNGRIKSLVINGDLFDFWFEWKSVIPRRGFRTLAELARLSDNGVEIIWVAGNHDCWGGDVITGDLGVQYTMKPWSGHIGPWNTVVEHADGLREKEDRKYRMVRPIMRSPLAIKMFRLLHPNLSTAIATGSSSASRSHGPADGGEGLRKIGHSRLQSDANIDLLVFGHSHIPALERTANKHGIFANAGSWLTDTTYIEVQNDSVSLMRWNGSQSKPDCLNRIDRTP